MPEVTVSKWQSGSWSQASLGDKGWTDASSVTVTSAVLSRPVPCPLPGTARSEGALLPPGGEAWCFPQSGLGKRLPHPGVLDTQGGA